MSAPEVINQPRKFQIKPRKVVEPVVEVVVPVPAPEPNNDAPEPPKPVKAVRAPPKPRVPLLPLEQAFIKEQTPENTKAVLDGYADHNMSKVVAHDGEGKSITCPLTSDGKWELRVVRKGTKVRCVLTTEGRRWLSEQLEGRPAPISTYCYE